jgi:cysteine-S-conjugate beta-lyase
VAFTQMIREKTGLYLSEGAEFGGNGRYFVRLNIACPGSVLMEGLERLKRALV